MSDYEFNLPFPPSINGYWRTFRNRQIISKRGREYRAKAHDVMQSLGLDNEKLSGRLEVRIVLNPPTLRRYDVDNFTKAVFDALTTCGFWVDDELVCKLTIIKGEKSPPGNVEVSIIVIN
ncbi:endodeoxyribonuclease [Vibrio phage 1.134.O._10N.222.52.B8]|nr:endodeoxyribonuclease [Vibrio phage 1.134.O._10N.222.52.B8]